MALELILKQRGRLGLVWAFEISKPTPVTHLFPSQIVPPQTVPLTGNQAFNYVSYFSLKLPQSVIRDHMIMSMQAENRLVKHMSFHDTKYERITYKHNIAIYDTHIVNGRLNGEGRG